MYDDQLYTYSAGFNPHTVTGNSNLDDVFDMNYIIYGILVRCLILFY